MPVSICSPTPKELAAKTQEAREQTWGMPYPPRRPAPPAGWIRVEFYSSLYKVRHEMPPDMEGDVMLHPSGGLDTRRVCRLWNLEECVPIDPMRWVPLERRLDNWLSPLAVQVLSEGFGRKRRRIMFIEPPSISPTTVHKRTFREASIMLRTSLALYFSLSYSVPLTLMFSLAKSYTTFVDTKFVRPTQWVLEEYTKYPIYKRDAQALSRQVKYHVGVKLRETREKWAESEVGRKAEEVRVAWRELNLGVGVALSALLTVIIVLLVGMGVVGAAMNGGLALPDAVKEPRVWLEKWARGGELREG